MLMRPRFALPAHSRARVEIIPLIDVVFFLLATFVIFSFMMSNTRALAVTPPHPGPPGERDSVTLQVSGDGSAYWNQERIAVAELPARLAAYRNSAGDPRVLIAGDEKASWGAVVAALDEVRKAGIQNFTFETRTRPTGR